VLNELQSAFRFNDAVIRNLVIKRPGPDAEPSPLAKSRDDRDFRTEPERLEDSDIDEEIGDSDNEEIVV
jgi:small subunit ribosomal protein S6